MKTMLLNSILQWSVVLGLILGAKPMLAKEFREELQKTLPLSMNGKIRLENVNGGVKIVAWDRAEVQLQAIKTARTEDRFNQTKIVIKTDPQFIQIKTEAPKTSTHSWWGGWWNNDPANVDYTLKVPSNARLESISTVNGGIDINGSLNGLHASSVNGRVKAIHIQGDCHLSTVNGGIDADLVQLEKGQSCHASTVNGAVSVRVPPETNADVEASTVNGGLHNDFGIQNKTKWPNQHLRATLGSGGAKIKMSAVNGSINLRRGTTNTTAKAISLEVQ